MCIHVSIEHIGKTTGLRPDIGSWWAGMSQDELHAAGNYILLSIFV